MKDIIKFYFFMVDVLASGIVFSILFLFFGQDFPEGMATPKNID